MFFQTQVLISILLMFQLTWGQNSILQGSGPQPFQPGDVIDLGDSQNAPISLDLGAGSKTQLRGQPYQPKRFVETVPVGSDTLYVDGRTQLNIDIDEGKSSQASVIPQDGDVINLDTGNDAASAYQTGLTVDSSAPVIPFPNETNKTMVQISANNEDIGNVPGSSVYNPNFQSGLAPISNNLSPLPSMNSDLLGNVQSLNPGLSKNNLLDNNRYQGNTLLDFKSQPSFYVGDQKTLQVGSVPLCTFPKDFEKDPHELSNSEFGYPKSTIEQALKNSLAAEVLQTLTEIMFADVGRSSLGIQITPRTKVSGRGRTPSNAQNGNLLYNGGAFSPLDFNTFGSFNFLDNNQNSHITPDSAQKEASKQTLNYNTNSAINSNNDEKSMPTENRSDTAKSNKVSTGTMNLGDVAPFGNYESLSQNSYFQNTVPISSPLLEESNIDRLFPPKTSDKFLDAPANPISDEKGNPFLTYNNADQRSNVDGPFSFNRKSLFAPLSSTPLSFNNNAFGQSSETNGELSSPFGSSRLFSGSGPDNRVNSGSQGNQPFSFSLKANIRKRRQASQLESISKTCSPTFKLLRQYKNHGSSCFVVAPEAQAVYFAECSNAPCTGCRAEGGPSRCTSERVPMWVWSYCEEGPNARLVMIDRLEVSVACTCKTARCQGSIQRR